MIELGKYYDLEVNRITDLGYMLSDNKEEVLLHFAQSKDKHEIGDKVHVFIYADKKERKTATEDIALVTKEASGFVKVVDKVSGVGVFVNINTPKDVLVPKDYLPYNESLWPIKDDYLYVILKSKRDTLIAKPLNRFDIIALHKNIKYAEYEIVSGYVSKVSDNGIGIISKDMMYIFVPRMLYTDKYRLGQEVNVTITKELEEEYYGTLNQHKELMIDTDREIILNYLKLNNGIMYLTAKSSAEEVFDLLKMSRKAFKRAYGGLYKDRIIEFDDTKTKLIK